MVYAFIEKCKSEMIELLNKNGKFLLKTLSIAQDWKVANSIPICKNIFIRILGITDQ